MEKQNNDKNLFAYTDDLDEQHTIELTPDLFTFKQADKKIHDVAFKQKPSSFGKDAVKRFAKNHSSIVASVILGIMVLLCVILPWAMPQFDVSTPHLSETYLMPKLFPAGTGWWDGTKTYTDQILNPETGYPDGDYQQDAISNIQTYPGFLENRTSTLGKGGYIRIAGSNTGDFVWSSNTVSLDASVPTTLTYVMDKDVVKDYGETSYYVAFSYSDGTSTQVFNMVSDSTAFGTQTIDVSQAMKAAGLSTIDNATLRFGIADSQSDDARGVFLKSVSLTANGTEDATVSFSDANQALLNSEWAYSTQALSGPSHVEITYCSFVYDTYKVAYGDQSNQIISGTQIQEYIDKGWMSYDWNVGPSSFKVLNDLNPIISIEAQRVESNPIFGIEIKEVTATVSRYKLLGYSHMPYHLFGTDENGRDMLKYVAEGTRNSLGISLIICLICFAFGLLYGSVEGYFGGNIDLFLERVVDVLGNIPWIVIVTLCVLHLGNSFGVFILAMVINGWIGTSSLTRTQFYRFKGREYVLAARSLGARDSRLIFRHILPNGLGTLVTQSVLMVPSVIFTEAAVSYLNIGLKGLPSLGVILSTNQAQLQTNPYLLVFPSVIIALMMICFNLFGNGLRDALNPSLKGSD